MIDSILPVRPPIAPPEIAAPSSEKDSGLFSSVLKTAVRTVEASREQSELSVEQFLQGGTTDLHSVLLDVQKAELTLDLFIQVRNKVTKAYEEIMRMQV
jgi:flagellar hook-basal body complex protein FliE